MTTKYKNHKKTTRLIQAQKVTNAALLLAYAHGATGWLAMASGQQDGFTSDYSFIHWNPGDFAAHRVYALYLMPSDYAAFHWTPHIEMECEEIMLACAAEYDGQHPSLEAISCDDISAAFAVVRSAWSEQPEGTELEQWLRKLCNDSASCPSSFASCDWEEMVLRVLRLGRNVREN